METLHTWWATELYPMRERDQFGVFGEFEVVLATDAQATIAALQAQLHEQSEKLKYHDLFKKWQCWRDPDELVDEYEKWQAAIREHQLLKEQLTQRTAELEAASKAIAEWRKEIDSVLDKLDDREGDVVALQAELERVRALIKALPKVEGDWTVSCALAVTVVTGGIVRDISEVVAAIVQHRQGMEG